MAMLGIGDYLCEACRGFDSDGIDGNHPNCSKQSWAVEWHRAIRLGEKCPYGFKPGIPSGYPVSMDRNRRRASEVMAKLGICEDETEAGF